MPDQRSEWFSSLRACLKRSQSVARNERILPVRALDDLVNVVARGSFSHTRFSHLQGRGPFFVLSPLCRPDSEVILKALS